MEYNDVCEKILMNPEGILTAWSPVVGLFGNKYGEFKGNLKEGLVASKCPVCGNDYFLIIKRTGRRNYWLPVEGGEKAATEELMICAHCGDITAMKGSLKNNNKICRVLLSEYLQAIIPNYNHRIEAVYWESLYEYDADFDKLYQCPNCGKMTKWFNKDTVVPDDKEMIIANEVWECDCREQKYVSFVVKENKDLYRRDFVYNSLELANKSHFKNKDGKIGVVLHNKPSKEGRE